MRTISIVNQKGGCGKTTTAINAAAALAELGKTVLLIDLDPQAHVTLGLGCDSDSLKTTTYDVLVQTDNVLRDAILQTRIAGFDLVPSNVLLGNVEVELADVAGRELLLDRCLRDLRDVYDLCVIDCPPSLNVLTLNALMASVDVIVPVQAHCSDMKGIRRLLETIRLIRERLQSHAAEHIHLLLTFVEDRGAFGQQVQQQVRDAFGPLVLSTTIHRSTSVAEAPETGQPVLTYAPRSRGATDYRALARELLDVLGLEGELPAVNAGVQARRPQSLVAGSDGAPGPEGESSDHPPGPVSIEST
jgi:chromosome partitioning protein